jgi:Arc/MetJ-type ribon-helix-helix transcriptional regulator
MKNTCAKHAYTNRSDVVRRCLNCKHTQWKVNGKWQDEQKPTKIKAPGKNDPSQLSLL